MKVTCKQCNKEFDKLPNQVKKTKNHFCSRSCAAKYNNKKYPKRRVLSQKLCKDCGTRLSYGTRHGRCHSCKRVHTLKVFNEHTVFEKTAHKYLGSVKWNAIRTRARSVLELENRLKVCENCGWDKHVNVCHVKPLASFPPNTKIAEVNAPDNLKYLCPNCHWEFDH